MMKNAFFFTVESVFVLKIFALNFGHVKKTSLIIEVWLTLVLTRSFIIFIAEFEQAFHIIPYSLLTL